MGMSFIDRSGKMLRQVGQIGQSYSESREYSCKGRKRNDDFGE